MSEKKNHIRALGTQHVFLEQRARRFLKGRFARHGAVSTLQMVLDATCQQSLKPQIPFLKPEAVERFDGMVTAVLISFTSMARSNEPQALGH